MTFMNPAGNKRFKILCLPALSSVCAATAIADLPPDVREVAVTIIVQKPDGSPLQQVPIALLTEAQGRFAFTDAHGVASFTIAKVNDEGHITAFMSSGLWFTPQEDRPAAGDRYNELRRTFAFKRLYSVAAVGAEPYSLTIQAKDAVTLTGRLIDPTANPMEGGIGAESTEAFDLVWPDDNGAFALSGVTKGQRAVLWYSGGNTPQQHRMVQNGPLLQTDVNIGDITVVNAPLNATVAITSTNYDRLFLKDKLDLAQEMTLIERSSLHVFAFDVARDTGKVWQDVFEDQPDDQLPLAAGTCFVVPGSLLSISRRAAYAALLAGRAQDLADAGVPLITVQAGRNPPVTVDAKAAVAAIMQVAGDLVED